ncbi:MAG: hypothetical protein JKX81_18450 [Arenicella sp.]|nr:hypothetical protein [Arenicella sp.]
MSIDLLNRRAIVLTVAFLSAFIISITPSSAAEQNKASSKVYFTLGDQHQFPLTEERSSFGCSDRIFTVVELSHMPKTKYDLAIVWIDPSNTERERTEYSFSVVAEETRLWSWLSLSPSTGAAMIQWINPAAGLEEFVGPWTVEIRINGRRITSKNFEVIC